MVEVFCSGGVGYLTVIVGVLVGYLGGFIRENRYEIHVWIEWSERSERYLSFFIFIFYFVINFVLFVCRVWGGGGVSKMGGHTKNGGEGG